MAVSHSVFEKKYAGDIVLKGIVKQEDFSSFGLSERIGEKSN